MCSETGSSADFEARKFMQAEVIFKWNVGFCFTRWVDDSSAETVDLIASRGVEYRGRDLEIGSLAPRTKDDLEAGPFAKYFGIKWEDDEVGQPVLVRAVGKDGNVLVAGCLSSHPFYDKQFNPCFGEAECKLTEERGVLVALMAVLPTDYAQPVSERGIVRLRTKIFMPQKLYSSQLYLPGDLLAKCGGVGYEYKVGVLYCVDLLANGSTYREMIKAGGFDPVALITD